MGSKYKFPNFYNNYASLFKKYFQSVSETTIKELDLAGLYIYQSSIRLDRIIDDGDNSEFFTAINLNEKAIQILSKIYDREDDFWVLWQVRKNEFQDAISLEKNLWINPTKENYEKVADTKSAFGKVAIDCLYLLSENKNYDVYQSLLESHKYFSIGFQLFDDVTDFREDFCKKQFNWAVHELSKYWI